MIHFVAKQASDWDVKNELGKANVRWAIILGSLVYLASVFPEESAELQGLGGSWNPVFIGTVAGVFGLLNFVYHLYLYRLRRHDLPLHAAWKYVSMTIDLIVLTLLLLPTGGSQSMFFLMYIVILLSNGMRYGMRLAIVGILLFNVLYVCLLFFQYYPSIGGDVYHKEILKISGVWVTGLYIGYLSRRFELLHTEAEKYRLLLQAHLAKTAAAGNASREDATNAQV